MLSIQPKSQRTTLTGTTPATIADAPVSGKTRMIVAGRAPNLDSLPVTFILKKVISGVAKEIDRREGVAVGEVWKDWATLLSRFVLLPTESLTMELAAPADSVQPVIVVEMLEGTDTP